MSFVNIETKEDSAEKLAQAAGKPTKNFLFAPEFNLLKNKVNEFYEAFILALNGKANAPIVRTGNFTPAINTVNHVTANATVTNPTGVQGLGYEIEIISGIVTLPNGQQFIAGTKISAKFLSSSWRYTAYYPNGRIDLVIVESGTITTDSSWNGKIVRILNASFDVTIQINHNIDCEGLKLGSGVVNFIGGFQTIQEADGFGGLIGTFDTFGLTQGLNSNQTIVFKTIR